MSRSADVKKSFATGPLCNLFGFINNISGGKSEDIGLPLLVHGILTALIHLLCTLDFRVMKQNLLHVYLTMLQRFVVTEPDPHRVVEALQAGIIDLVASLSGKKKEAIIRFRIVEVQVQTRDWKEGVTGWNVRKRDLEVLKLQVEFQHRNPGTKFCTLFDYTVRAVPIHVLPLIDQDDTLEVVRMSKSHGSMEIHAALVVMGTRKQGFVLPM
ncbi:hypothetical protein DFH07DRAFT_774276 [Mycena maculata]|uniref:Uncharacterized protein n=1 Tax=Mycena maculata TaxID=230809 RepID=A0AAD7IXP9_9AGAR|nr:hypothetical protein DFH07DRAFT_774276 [Mycena maculata]